jgi:23S rRNA (uracil1939-C5)-methyltransferase
LRKKLSTHHSKLNTTFQMVTLDLSIESIGFEGKAIARDGDGLVYFVDGGVPGDVVRVEVRKKKKTYAEARLLEILTPSPHRQTPQCRYFGTCGGCKWQHLAYSEQCSWKKRHVQDAFERLGKVPYTTLHDTLPSENQFYYRNKMEFSFGDVRWLTTEEISTNAPVNRQFALGLHIPGRFDKVLDVEECFLQSEISSRIVNAIRTAALERSASIFQTRTHEGFLRNVVIRTSVATGEIMVILVTSPADAESDERVIAWFENDFVQTFPELTTAIHAVTASKGTVAVGEPRIVHGSGFITEVLLGVKYRISPFSFFQTNTRQAETLFRVALEYAGDLADKTVWDLYCGTGSITLAAARKARFVAGLEIVESSILDARANAAMNGISNVEFTIEDMQKAVKKQILSRLPAPDVVIVDPPRAGMHEDVVRNLLEIAPPVLVYVSCNPTTQARDCAILAEKYSVEELQPVDMFPHTYHIESVARLVRKRE